MQRLEPSLTLGGSASQRGDSPRADDKKRQTHARGVVSNFVIHCVVPFQVALRRINRFVNGG
jgi:hypothetical protein